MALPEPSINSIISSTAMNIFSPEDVIVDKDIIVEPNNTYVEEPKRTEEEPDKTEPDKTEPDKTEPDKTEPIKDENSKEDLDDEEGVSEEEKILDEPEEKAKNVSSAAHKRFAEMRTQVRDLRKENDELKKNTPAEATIPEELTKELDELRGIVKSYAVKSSPEYLKEVIGPHKHGSDTLHSLASTYAVEIDYKKIEEVCVNGELTKAQREDTYEDLGIEMGIPDARLVKFVRACMEIDTATELNAKYTSESDKFKEEFLQNLKEQNKEKGSEKEEVVKEVDTSSLTVESLEALIKKYGLVGVDVAEINKSSQEKAKSGSLEEYHKAAVLEAVSAKLATVSEELEKAMKRIEKFKSSRPLAKMSAKKQSDKSNHPQKFESIESLVGGFMKNISM